MSLDDALAAWAATVRLPDSAAADMYQRIIHTPTINPAGPPGLDPGWWRRFTAEYTTRMVASTQPTRWAA
jgi:hypothetical protein